MSRKLQRMKSSCKRAGGAVRCRECVKKTKYSSLDDRFCFVPIAIETLGTWGDEGKKLIDEIGEKLSEKTRENRSKSYLIQRISIALQRGNAASILGTIPDSKEKLDTVYYITLSFLCATYM